MNTERIIEGTFKGKVALLTNVDRGVGLATAKALTRLGAALALTVEDMAAGPAILEELAKMGGIVALLQAPARLNCTEANRLLRAVTERLGRLDIVIANAQRRVQWQVDDTTADEDAIDEQFYVNVMGTISLLRAAVRVIGDGGRIIAVGASVAKRVGTPGLADFAATQAAIAAYCRGIAHDLGPRAVTVNVVQLGAMEADQVSASGNLIEAELDATVLKRLGRAEEVSNAIIFLASSGASFITGTVVDVDGGYNA